MSPLKILSPTLILALSLLSCARRETVDEAPEVIVEMEVVPSPPMVGPSLLMIQIIDEEGDDLGDFTIDVRGDMSHAGMTPVIATDIKGDRGTFAVPFDWTMAGDWFVSISATLPDERKLIRALPVQVEP